MPGLVTLDGVQMLIPFGPLDREEKISSIDVAEFLMPFPGLGIGLLMKSSRSFLSAPFRDFAVVFEVSGVLSSLKFIIGTALSSRFLLLRTCNFVKIQLKE